MLDSGLVVNLCSSRSFRLALAKVRALSEYMCFVLPRRAKNRFNAAKNASRGLVTHQFYVYRSCGKAHKDGHKGLKCFCIASSPFLYKRSTGPQ